MFSINTSLTPDDKIARRITTAKYGYITLLVSLGVVVFLLIRSYIAGFLPRKIRRPIPLPLVVVTTTGVLLLLSFLQTHDDYIYLTKRLGRVSAAIMPVLVFLSLKPSPIPRESYLRLLPLHIWLGRILFVLGTAHGVLYLVYFAKTGHPKKILHPPHFLGVLLMAGFLLTFLTSFYIIRKYNHELFFRSHIALSWIYIPLLAYHSSPRAWIIVALLMLFGGAQLFQRFGYSQDCRVEVNRISSSLLLVTLPRNLFPKYFEAGSHVRFSPTRQDSSWWFLAASHPYTIASLCGDDDTVRLVVAPSKRFKFENDGHYLVHGPYASLSYDFFVDMYKSEKTLRRTLIIAGGAGISFAIPIARTLRKMNENVKVIWTIRSQKDIQILRILNFEDINVFVSTNEEAESLLESTEFADSSIAVGNDIPQLELQTAKATLDEQVEPDQNRLIHLNQRRLDIEKEVQDFLATLRVESADSNMWLISCGGRNLVSQCSKVGRKFGAIVHEEVYDV
ncbi:uncharacterized protein V1516DRAFT_651229 [Lipomyces oligophaga]|uniref:uncharacterized protein n=1 Tax=Lipomyces oligophaga TaxID=45792 RepID=UPI0034CDA7B7